MSELEKLAIQIYETRYEYLTPLQKQELDNHITAKKKLENVSTDEEVKRLLKNCVAAHARKKTRDENI